MTEISHATHMQSRLWLRVVRRVRVKLYAALFPAAVHEAFTRATQLKFELAADDLRYRRTTGCCACVVHSPFKRLERACSHWEAPWMWTNVVRCVDSDSRIYAAFHWHHNCWRIIIISSPAPFPCQVRCWPSSRIGFEGAFLRLPAPRN